MNKRILKLFNEAGFHQPEMERQGLEDKFEKFAELIVQECIDILPEKVKIHDIYDGSILVQCGMAIKEHFGVGNERTN